MSKLEFNYWFVLIRAAGTFCVEPSPLQTTGEKCCQNEVRGTKFKFQVEGTIVVTGFYSVYFFKEKLQKKKKKSSTKLNHSQPNDLMDIASIKILITKHLALVVTGPSYLPRGGKEERDIYV